MASGLLLVFEGPEGAGKSTQVARVAGYLEKAGVPHAVHREPGGTSAGERIRSILLDPVGNGSGGHVAAGSGGGLAELSAEAECLLFLASRAELVRRVILAELAAGKVVVLDRFFLSTYAYQVRGRGLAEDMVRSANALATGGLVPDLTILLNIDSTTGMKRAAKRGAHDRMELAGTDFHTRVGGAFAEFGTVAWQKSHPECGIIQFVDASGTEEQVFGNILSVLQNSHPIFFGEQHGN